MTKSSSRSPAFKPEEYLRVCESRRKALARIVDLQDLLKILDADEGLHKEAVTALKNDIADIVAQPIVHISQYTGLLDLINDSNKINIEARKEREEVANEISELREHIANVENAIKAVKSYFRNEKRKVVSLEGKRSQRQGC